MKITVVLLVAFVCFSSPVWAGQKYNPMEDRFETVPDDYEMRYDPMGDEFSYESPDAQLGYNPMEDTFNWNPEPESDSYSDD